MEEEKEVPPLLKSMQSELRYTRKIGDVENLTEPPVRAGKASSCPAISPSPTHNFIHSLI
jgi:hypothetical protein